MTGDTMDLGQWWDAGPMIGFRRHLRAEVVAGEAAYLFSERGVTALVGPSVEALAPLLDGTRHLSEVMRDLPAGVSPEQVGDVVARLVDAGLVGWRPQPRPGVDRRPDPQTLAYWDSVGLDAETAVGDITGATVRVITVGQLAGSTATSAIVSTLGSAGVTVAGEQDLADMSVVLCDDYLDPALADIGTAHRVAGRPWLLAKPVGATIWIGPVFEPAGQGCWQCLAARLAGHRQAETYVQSALGRQGPAPRYPVSVPPLAAMAMNLVTLESMKWLAGHRYPGQRSVWTFDSFGMRGRHHELRPRPQCAGCGDPGLVRAAAHRPVLLRPRLKVFVSGGGHRSMRPDQVLDRYRHLISPVTGVIKEIKRDNRGPAFFQSFRSGPNIAMGARTLRGLKSALRVENGGKGTTALDAEVGALCEALERHSGSFHGDEERIHGSLRALGDRAMHPNSCQLYHDRQYAERTDWNQAHSPFQYVCAPFDDTAVIDWSPVWSLTEQRHRLLPTSMLYFGAPTPPGPLYTRADSNGNAAGSSIEDAVLQGLLEIVERDAVAQWWYNRTRVPAVDLDAFGDPWLHELRNVYADLGREVWVIDVTSDLRVPTMVALSRRGEGPGETITFGFGAHLDPQTALRRALTEMNQLMPAMAELTPDSRHADDDPDAAHWLRYATVENQPYLLPDPAVRPNRPDDYGYLPSQDLADDVRTIQDRLTGLGLELMVLDQTRPDIELPVVKVIVPGMRHFWARFGPGRLYDVPVSLGRLAVPTPYEELNPIPLFA